MATLETARLLLRQVTLDDAEDYYQAVLCDPDVRRYLPGGQPLPRERAEPILQRFMDQWKANNFGGWAVIHKKDRKLIGQCGLQFVPNLDGEVEVFYAIAKPYWGQGLVTEAARAALRYGFDTVGLNRIVAFFIPGNIGSERVMVKIGMKYQGVRHVYDMDLPCYAIVSDEFRPGDAPYHLTIP